MIIDALSSLEILSLTIIGEARGEPIQGQVAVGCVCRNRLHHSPTKYKDYRDVCLENLQFSCWNSSDPNFNVLVELGEKLANNQTIDDPYLRQCMWVAKGVEDWSIIDNVKGSMYYLEKNLFDNKRPIWARAPKTNPITIGKQIFFDV